jgi:hypothetical protein
MFFRAREKASVDDPIRNEIQNKVKVESIFMDADSHGNQICAGHSRELT